MRYKCVTIDIQLLSSGISNMPAQKTATLNLRVDPTIKEAIRIAAKRQHRSIANMVEILIREHCERTGISIPEQQNLFDEGDD